MSTIFRRKRASRLNLDPYRRSELLYGEIRYPLPSHYTGYGDMHGLDLRAFITPEMKADWAANRDGLIAFWKSGRTIIEAFPEDCLPWLPYAAGRPGTVPWACVHLDGIHDLTQR
jgi:hypothetical protein